MPTPRSYHTATVLQDGRILLAGGMLNGVALTNVEIYDPVSNSYQPTGSLNVPRLGHSATLLPDGRVLVIGGLSAIYPRGYYLYSAEIYDPSSGAWSPHSTAVLPWCLSFSDLAPGWSCVGGRRRFPVIGPRLGDDRVEIFDPAQNVWSAAAYHEGIGESHPDSVLLNDGRVLFTSGRQY